MSYYTLIKPKQDHLIKKNTRKVSLKVIPNTEVVSKEINQPRATITNSDYNQGEKELQKNHQGSDTVAHIICPNSGRIRGFKVSCLNGKILNTLSNKIQVNPQSKDRINQLAQLRPQKQIYNSFEPIVRQRQPDQFIFSLQPNNSSRQAVSPVTLPNKPSISQNKHILIQQKQKTIIESVVSREQSLQRGGFIQIEQADQQQILKKKEQQILSNQIKHYQIEEINTNNHQNLQIVKSPSKENYRHPIFTNQNAEFFEESAFQSKSINLYPQYIKANEKYTPIHNIESPKHHFVVNEPNQNGVESKYEDKSFYLNNQKEF